MVFYRSVVQLHETLKIGFPEYKNYNPRMHASETSSSTIHIGPQLRTEFDLRGKSFIIWRASGQYNMIPENLRKTDKLAVFKKELKKWTWLNIPI